MNIVLFLGAGFSAAYNLPVMNSFLEFADTCKRIDDSDREFLGKLVLESRSANSFLASSPTNIEDILSFSIMGDRLSIQRNNKNTRNVRIRTILQKIFTHVTDVDNYWRNFDYFEDFLTFNPKDDHLHKLSIITTNYDICIESALMRIGNGTYPGFDFVQIEDKASVINHGNLYNANGIPVYKLHGSVNWFPYKNTFQVEGRIVRINRRSARDETDALPYVNTSGYSSEKTPVIIPPSFLKPDLQGPLNKIWGSAAKTLSEANVLVFIGYSFPSTDTEMMYFLAKSLTGNATLRKIILIDPIASTTFNRLNSEDSKFGLHFRNLLDYYDSDWQLTSLKNFFN